MKIIQLTISGETSSIIRAIRFPLAILVVMLHSGIAVTEWQYHIIAAPTAKVDIYMYMYIAVCETLCRVAVPLFFFISGYLFFSGMDKWSWVKYKEKMSKRIQTLLVPYLIWVTLFVLLCLAKNYLQHHSISSILEYINVRNGLLMWLNGVTTESGVDILGKPTYQSFPLLYPMWYIRDLFAMTIITPPHILSNEEETS